MSEPGNVKCDGWREAGLVCQACAGDAPGGKCKNPKCIGGPIVRELVPADGMATCPTCKGARVVDDGEITHSDGGCEYQNGPIKCVADCQTCKGTGTVGAGGTDGR